MYPHRKANFLSFANFQGENFVFNHQTSKRRQFLMGIYVYIFFLSVGAGDTKWHFASMLHLPHYYCHMCVYVPHASRGFDVPLSSALVIFMAKHISQYVYIVYILHIQHSRLRGNRSTFLFCGWRDVIANFCYAISLGKVPEKKVCSIMIDWLMFY